MTKISNHFWWNLLHLSSLFTVLAFMIQHQSVKVHFRIVLEALASLTMVYLTIKSIITISMISIIYLLKKKNKTQVRAKTRTTFRKYTNHSLSPLKSSILVKDLMLKPISRLASYWTSRTPRQSSRQRLKEEAFFILISR